MRCLISQSRLSIPAAGEEDDVASGGCFGFLDKRWRSLDKSGKAKVLVGGCSESKCVEIKR